MPVGGSSKCLQSPSSSTVHLLVSFPFRADSEKGKYFSEYEEKRTPSYKQTPFLNFVVWIKTTLGVFYPKLLKKTSNQTKTQVLSIRFFSMDFELIDLLHLNVYGRCRHPEDVNFLVSEK